jgi:hypothetical protein
MLCFGYIRNTYIYETFVENNSLSDGYVAVQLYCSSTTTLHNLMGEISGEISGKIGDCNKPKLLVRMSF